MRRIGVLGALVALGALASGCGSGDDPPAGAKVLSFELTDAGCVPHSASAPAGPITFEAKNEGSSAVTEIEVMEGDSILGEKENLSAGLSGSFTLTLDAGEYTVYCPGGSNERGTLTVSGETDQPTAASDEAVVADYRRYLKQNVNELLSKTKAFVAALDAGEAAKAKALYSVARAPYERIEPVAEQFGELDPDIDARANDVPPAKFIGFHRIEKALWAEGGSPSALRAMRPVDHQLLEDIEALGYRVTTLYLLPPQIANGANELLSEVSSSKITGEEERYSHTDLVDFEANVEGAEEAFETVEPLLHDRSLADEVEQHFEDVEAALRPYRRGEGFVPYTALSRSDIRKLAQEIDALAEELSQVPAQIVGGSS